MQRESDLSFNVLHLVVSPLLQIHFSNNDFLGVRIRVMLKGKLVFYSRSEVLEIWSWRSGVQPSHLAGLS